MEWFSRFVQIVLACSLYIPLAFFLEEGGKDLFLRVFFGGGTCYIIPISLVPLLRTRRKLSRATLFRCLDFLRDGMGGCSASSVEPVQSSQQRKNPRIPVHLCTPFRCHIFRMTIFHSAPADDQLAVSCTIVPANVVLASLVIY